MGCAVSSADGDYEGNTRAAKPGYAVMRHPPLVAITTGAHMYRVRISALVDGSMKILGNENRAPRTVPISMILIDTI